MEIAQLDTRNRTVGLLLSLASFLSGCIIYVFSRSTDMVIYRWIGWNPEDSMVSGMRNTEHGNAFVQFLVYCIPDGLWLYSYMLLIYVLWGKKTSRNAFIWLLPLFAVLMEVLQATHLVSGTGDWKDVLAYTIFIILFLFTIKHLQK